MLNKQTSRDPPSTGLAWIGAGGHGAGDASREFVVLVWDDEAADSGVRAKVTRPNHQLGKQVVRKQTGATLPRNRLSHWANDHERDQHCC